jgi:hypothetical protein
MRAAVAIGIRSQGALAARTMPRAGVAWGPRISSKRMMVTFANMRPHQIRLGLRIHSRPLA